MLGGKTTDAQDASAVSHQRNAIDIYSNSWGPADYGCIVGGPETLTLTALEEGTQSVWLYLFSNNIGNCWNQRLI